MRIIISIFFLFFSKSIFSDEITDFEINGFSVVISLLEFLTEKEIINKTYYEIEQGNNKEMGFVNFTDKEINLNNFFLVKAWYKKNDPKSFHSEFPPYINPVSYPIPLNILENVVLPIC